MNLLDRIDYLRARYLKHWTLGGVKVTMFCPACKQRLHPWRYAERYETLEEHVDNPNQDLPYKPVFKCITNTCPLYYATGAFFGYEGRLYSGATHHDERYWSAIGSLSWIVDQETKRREVRTYAR